MDYRCCRLDIKKIGNHWYPCLDHFDPNQISLDPRLEELLNIVDMDHMEMGHLTVYLRKIDCPEGKMILQFDKRDIDKYFIADEEFEINTYIDDYHFYVSSVLYLLMENTYKLDFHKNLYRLEIW